MERAAHFLPRGSAAGTVSLPDVADNAPLLILQHAVDGAR
jgi:hypothetical protein